MSLTSVLKDSVSAADSALDSTPWCMCPVLISPLSVPYARGGGGVACFHGRVDMVLVSRVNCVANHLETEGFGFL